MDDFIDYQSRAQNALRHAIRDILIDVAKDGLPGAHHFYITFDTEDLDVRLSDTLKQRFPKDMTVVLQHQFDDLTVTDEGFSVRLSFGGKPEDIYVPFAAISRFFDPSVEFGLEFNPPLDLQEDFSDFDEDEENAIEADDISLQADNESAEIFSLDSFRDK